MARGSKTSGVRGPNSALTEFLRVEGITDGFRNRRNRQSEPAESVLALPDVEDEPQPVTVNRRRGRGRLSRAVEEEEEEDVDEDDEIVVMRSAARTKRRLARRNGDGPDSDYSSEGSNFSEDDNESKNKKFGEKDECVDCENTFLISVYSRYDDARKGYLCEDCHEELKKRERNARKNQLNARRKRKKMALALLDKAEVKVPSLQDVCIKKITQNIDDVDVLGDIGQANMNKISRILSRNRSMNSTTATLFLHPDLKTLELWDCSNVDSDALNKIALFCPQLESLTLFMCGHLHNDNLKYYNAKLPHLKSLSLNGPFLISDIMWQEFFEGDIRLSQFEVRNTHRFGNDSLISLLETTGSNLTLLKLSRLDGLNSAAIYELIPHYIQPNMLKHLEISYPTDEDLITDELMINILSISGESLTHLNVDGCTSLTDRFLEEGVSKFCPALTSLSMKLLDQVTDAGFSRAFDGYSFVNSGGLIDVNLTKCTGLEDGAIYSLFRHSGPTLVELNLNSIYKLTKDFFIQIFTDDLNPKKKALKEAVEAAKETEREAEPLGTEDEDEIQESPQKYFLEIKLPLLTTLDVGFVRAVDNEVLNLVSEKCTKLKILEVHGNNRCTSRATVREGLLIIGRQSDCM